METKLSRHIQNMYIILIKKTNYEKNKCICNPITYIRPYRLCVYYFKTFYFRLPSHMILMEC